MAAWRFRHPTALAVVLAVAVTAAAPAALPAEHAAPASAARTAAAATASGRYELVSTVDPTRPMRWPACRPIEYRINPTDMPSGMVATVQHAMGVVARQTGVRFRFAGRTAHLFDSTNHAATPTIYIGFTNRAHAFGQTFGGTGGEVGVGGPAASWYRSGGRTVEAMTYGRVLLSSRFRAPRTGGGVSWQSLILHEVGHALDLAHQGGPGTIMHPSLTAATPAQFTPAEVRALRRVLQTSGCDDAAWSRL
ncbi:matrixin family metalloprotease [Amnibacterium kyonggiense]|uniref:Matrixin n=1 Tax=Amnibacterium kyonggiense TaxID=595671 RepID=A0A4R7FIQ6_9MICO|nr:matrixin family metalloprotease [Amnibacterium kyonggiense]TDS74928.1 matrixin [Amnibacterium kyonggiense]